MVSDDRRREPNRSGRQHIVGLGRFWLDAGRRRPRHRDRRLVVGDLGQRRRWRRRHERHLHARRYRAWAAVCADGNGDVGPHQHGRRTQERPRRALVDRRLLPRLLLRDFERHERSRGQVFLDPRCCALIETGAFQRIQIFRRLFRLDRRTRIARRLHRHARHRRLALQQFLVADVRTRERIHVDALDVGGARTVGVGGGHAEPELDGVAAPRRRHLGWCRRNPHERWQRRTFVAARSTEQRHHHNDQRRAR